MTAVTMDSGIDASVPWHYGDPMREQRLIESGHGVVDRSHRGVVTVTGPDRLTWLHSLTTQHLERLAPGAATTALVLSPNGHLEHVLYGVDDGTTFWAHTEPERAAELAGWLDRMRFMMRVEVADRTADVAVLWSPDPAFAPAALAVRARAADALGGSDFFVTRDELPAILAGQPLAGTWAYEARRIAAGVPRFGMDTDHRTIPNEIGVIGVAVHLEKGCYRGQETVARVHTLGRPPRRLVLLHLDGSADALPAVGAALEHDGRTVGFVGGSARHFELGPIALGLIKRNVPIDAELLAEGIPAAQEVLVDPEIGLHVRPKL